MKSKQNPKLVEEKKYKNQSRNKLETKTEKKINQ